MTWLSTNFPAVLSIAAAVLSVAIGIAHLVNATAVATQLQSFESVLQGLIKPPTPPSV